MEEKIKYLPFNAVNEFMRDDYRITIISDVLSQIEKSTPIQKQLIKRLISKNVSISGFRDSSLAPLNLKVKNCSSLFERSADFSSLIMECWCNLHTELKKTIGNVLHEKGWEIQPIDIDHSQLPGFQIDWPKTDSFESIIQSVKEKTPNTDESDDNISLMAVWIGNKLPYNLYAENAEKSD